MSKRLLVPELLVVPLVELQSVAPFLVTAVRPRVAIHGVVILPARLKRHCNRESGQVLKMPLVDLAHEEVGRHVAVDSAEAEVVLTVEHLGGLSMDESAGAEKAQVHLAGLD